ncbi:hypothetical protein [Ferrimonas gelatinilytica]|uniref:Copper-binding protein n=1 Tax=Ferrimonas gelatinilytica TaxID=1255257 RepID=A0ABP9S310_9GAMM
MKKIVIPGLFAALITPVAFASNCHGSSDGSAVHGDHHGMHARHHQAGSPVGRPGDANSATRTIEVHAYDSMQFKFSEPLNFVDGEVVTFVVTNHGQIAHELSIGNHAEHEKHREMMLRMAGMDHDHDDGQTLTVAPGQTGRLTWQFQSGDDLLFACNIPGHFEAGMHQAGQIAKNGRHH